MCLSQRYDAEMEKRRAEAERRRREEAQKEEVPQHTEPEVVSQYV